MDHLRVLVIDDSLTIRALIEEIVDQEPGCEIVGMAGDIATARLKIAELAPNVVTLDLALPDQNGLDLLDELNAQNRPPVVVVSSSTKRGSPQLQEAFSYGADACFDKSKLISERRTFLGMLHDVVRSRRLQNVSDAAFDDDQDYKAVRSNVGTISYERIIAEHDRIEAAVDELAAILDMPEFDETAAGDALEELATQLKEHLEYEDSLIYPRIKLSQDEESGDDAAALMESFAKLRMDWNSYVHDWNPQAIASDDSGFRNDSRVMMYRIKQRVLEENAILYPHAMEHGYACSRHYV